MEKLQTLCTLPSSEEGPTPHRRELTALTAFHGYTAGMGCSCTYCLCRLLIMFFPQIETANF